MPKWAISSDLLAKDADRSIVGRGDTTAQTH